MVLFDHVRDKQVVENVDDGTHFKYDREARKRRFDKGTRLKDIFVILCAGFALISDGYQNNVMSMLNTVYAMQFPKDYDSLMKTNVSNASLITTIVGQVVIGISCDYIGRKTAIVVGTFFLIFGSIICAASHGSTIHNLLMMLIAGRALVGFGIGAEYPASSVSASEAANNSVKKRGMVFVLVTNLPLSFGGPFALIVFLIVVQITKTHLDGLWRTMFAIGCFWPLSVLYFRLKLSTSELYKRSAIKKSPVPYWLTLKYYWPRMIGKYPDELPVSVAGAVHKNFWFPRIPFTLATA